MIITEFYKGQGFGNQLWCYVVTRVIARQHGYSFGIQSPEQWKGGDFMRLNMGEQVSSGSGPDGGPPKQLPVGITGYYHERQITHPHTGADITLFDQDLINVPDNTKIDGCMQDEQYILGYKEEIREWLKTEPIDTSNYIKENTCVINFRGGEYTRHPELFLSKKYWSDAMENMRKINSDLTFIVITDDVKTGKKLFPGIDVYHFSIAMDYSIINQAPYLILSNSSFAWFPAWLNQNLKYCIAPKYWARHNVSDGYWSMGYNMTTGWMYQDRDGALFDYDTCKREFVTFQKTHAAYYMPKKIEKNFLVVSNYNRDLRWIPRYTDNYLIYDRSEHLELPETIDPTKVRKSPNVGYNSYDYFTYIIDHYDKLPDCVIFAKSWTFPRHVRKEYFDRIMNNDWFTPIEDWKMHSPTFPISFFSAEGGYCEINNGWYFKHLKHKYFHNYNDFLRYVYKDPIIPRYTRFAPGGDYIVPRAHILKLPKVLYENMRLFMSHCAEPAETHMIERAMYTLWTSNFELNEAALIPLHENSELPNSEQSPVLIKQTVTALLKQVLPGWVKQKIAPFIKK